MTAHQIPDVGTLAPTSQDTLAYIAGTRGCATRITSIQLAVAEQLNAQGLITFEDGGWVALTAKGARVAKWIDNGGRL